MELVFFIPKIAISLAMERYSNVLRITREVTTDSWKGTVRTSTFMAGRLCDRQAMVVWNE